MRLTLFLAPLGFPRLSEGLKEQITPEAEHRTQSALVFIHLTFAVWQLSQDSRSFLEGPMADEDVVMKKV